MQIEYTAKVYFNIYFLQFSATSIPSSPWSSDDQIPLKLSTKKKRKKNKNGFKTTKTIKKRVTNTTRFKRKKGVKPEDQENAKNLSTTKLKLMTILNDRKSQFQKLIGEWSIKATRIASLASMLLLEKINHHYYQNDQAFFLLSPDHIVEDSFYEILDPNIKTQGKKRIQNFPHLCLEQFAQAMRNANIRRPNNKYMGNIFKYLYQMYCTNFKTNIVLHAQQRIENYFKTLDCSKRERKATIAYLFQPLSRRQPKIEHSCVRWMEGTQIIRVVRSSL